MRDTERRCEKKKEREREIYIYRERERERAEVDGQQAKEEHDLRQQDDVLDVPDEPSSPSSKPTTEEVKRKPARRVLKLRKFSRSELQGSCARCL